MAVTLMTGTLLRDGTVMLGGQGGVILVRRPGEQSFERAGNPDRQSIAAMVQLADGNVLVAGLGGVRKVDDSGLPISATSNEQ